MTAFRDTSQEASLVWSRITAQYSLKDGAPEYIIGRPRKLGRYAKCWLDNVKEWNKLDSPTLMMKAEDLAGRTAQT